MFPLAADLRTNGLGTAKAIFSALLPKSTPTTRDAKLLYNERLARIDKTFPVTSDKEKTINTEACAVLKSAAKGLFDRDLTGEKK